MEWNSARRGRQKQVMELDLGCALTEHSAILYSGLSSGTWTILIEAAEHGFTVQRQFNLTIGARDYNTVFVTVRQPPCHSTFRADNARLPRPFMKEQRAQSRAKVSHTTVDRAQRSF